MKIDLTGKNALVTGASRGIGRACALTLAEAGADIACIDIEESMLSETVSEIEKLGRKALPIQANVSEYADAEKAVNETAEKMGSLDILLNNAGITRDGLLMRMSDADWDSVLAVNLKGPFNFIKAAGRTMARQRAGSIINMASVAGVMGNAGQANYSSSKGGLISLTKTAAKEFGSRNVRVNAVAPGFINTQMANAVDQKILDQVIAQIPFKRMGEPQDIANAVLFLGSDLSTYITGQVLLVDGGMVM